MRGVYLLFINYYMFFIILGPQLNNQNQPEVTKTLLQNQMISTQLFFNNLSRFQSIQLICSSQKEVYIVKVLQLFQQDFKLRQCQGSP
jgi:hypothetical protein